MEFFGLRQAVSVLVADDHPSADRALTDALRDDDRLSVVGHVADSQQAIDLAQALNPDVVVLGLRDPERMAEATRGVSKTAPGARVLVLVDTRMGPSMRDAAAGAFGYVRTDELSTEALRLVIELAAAWSRTD